MSARLLKDPSTVNCRIFIGNLQTDKMTKMDLEDHFSKYGNIIGSVMNRGFGFVQFENEDSAQTAIRDEAGQMFKGRRIDVKPAKKEGPFTSQQFANRPPQQRSLFPLLSQSFTPKSQSFAPSNQSFNSSTPQNMSFEETSKLSENAPQQDFSEDQEEEEEEEDPEGDQEFSESQNNNSFNANQDKEDESFNQQNSNRTDESGGGGSFSGGNSNGSNANSGTNNNQGKGGNQNRLGGNQNQNKNQNNQGANQGGNQMRTRGNRGGKNQRNKNRDNMGGSNFRDRSPLNRGNRDDLPREWEMNKMRGSGFGPRDYNEPLGRFDDRFRDMMPAPNVRPMGPPDYPPAVEKNDCEIIVVHKSLTEYAEAIEARLKKIGLTVDLLFPNEEVSLSRVLGNIANRGCLYAVVVVPINLEHHSLTLNILHGLPQEHRNMPVEDALSLISRDFSNYKSGGRGVPLNTPFASDRHPDAIQVLLNMLADNHQLTVLQYERVLKYLEIKREEQVQVELGDTKDLQSTTQGVSDPKQAELQSRILNILNSNRPNANEPSPVPAPAPVPPATWAAADPSTTSTTSTSGTGVAPSPLLNDPTVQKALDSLLQGNLLKSIGDPQSTTTSSSQPLFAAFPNINRL